MISRTLLLAVVLIGPSPAGAQALQLASLTQQTTGCQDVAAAEQGALAELTIALSPNRVGPTSS